MLQGAVFCAEKSQSVKRTDADFQRINTEAKNERVLDALYNQPAHLTTFYLSIESQ